MSRADVLFKQNCASILDDYNSDRNFNVRPKWSDGTPAHTFRKFCIVDRYDLREEFPILTLRPVPIKSAVDEMLWIWQKKSNDTHKLKSHVWDQWADKKGTIGKSYGYHQSIKYQYPEGLNTQLDHVLYELKHNPMNRRLIVSMWNPADLKDMALAPCAYSMTFEVTDNGGRQLVLNGILNQRSQDMVVANGWNTAQYAILLMMVAQSVGMIAGEFVHVIADCHIYDRHIPIVEELLKRKSYPAPIVKLNKDVKDFYDFTADDVIVQNYQHNKQIRNIEVAI